MCFNGAAVFRPRRVPDRLVHDLPDVGASMEPRSFDRGGRRGPHLLSPRTSLASMEPRSFDRGGCSETGAVGRVTSCFNGAAVFRPRRGRAGSSRCRRSSRFNGAAVFRPRRASTWPSTGSRGSGFNGAAVFRPRRGGTLGLPARRAPASMEPRSFDRGGVPAGACGHPGLRAAASMEPRSFDRGGERSASSAGRAWTRFNGAAVFRPRRGTIVESTVMES